jgi:hypothetical protein
MHNTCRQPVLYIITRRKSYHVVGITEKSFENGELKCLVTIEENRNCILVVFKSKNKAENICYHSIKNLLSSLFSSKQN